MSQISSDSWDRAQLSPLERLLRLFSDVRPGEGRVVLLMFANVLLLLCAYYLMKPLREGWLAVSGIEGLSKMELKAYTSFGQAIVLMWVLSMYSRLVGRWPRHVLISRVTYFCMAVTVVFWLLQPEFLITSLPFGGIVFYIWIGMFGVFVIAQFWAFAADLFTDDRGRRLIPVIAIGATSGAVVGSWFAKQTISLGLLSTEYLLLASLVPLALTVVITNVVHNMESSPSTSARADAASVEPVVADPRGALSLLVGTKILLAIAIVTMLTNWVNTNGENILFRVIQETVEQEVRTNGIVDAKEVLQYVRDQTTVFYSDFFFWVNILALFLQAVVASRLLRFGGFGSIFLVLPVIALISYSVMALVPVLMAIKIMKIAENATDYSLSNTARHVFWLPFDAATTFKGKPAVDSMVVRFGDGFAALTVLLGVHVFNVSLVGYLTFNFLLAFAWLGLAVWVVIAHRRLRESAAGAV